VWFRHYSGAFEDTFRQQTRIFNSENTQKYYPGSESNLRISGINRGYYIPGPDIRSGIIFTGLA